MPLCKAFSNSCHQLWFVDTLLPTFFGLGNSQQSISLSHPNGLFETYRILQIVVQIKCKLARGSNIPIILSICQTLNCFLILRFNRSFSSPRSTYNYWTKWSDVFPPLMSWFIWKAASSWWSCSTENWPLWCQNSDPNHLGVLCWSKTICCCRLELWQRLLYYCALHCSKLTQEMLDNCGCCYCSRFSMHTEAEKYFLTKEKVEFLGPKLWSLISVGKNYLSKVRAGHT